MRNELIGISRTLHRATEQLIALEDEAQREQAQIVPWAIECSIPGLSIKDAGNAKPDEAMRRIQLVLDSFSAMTTSKTIVDETTGLTDAD